MPDQELVEIYKGGGGDLRASFFVAALRDEGIECLVSSGGAIAAHPINVGPMGEFRLLVRPEDETPARQIVDALVASETDVSDPDGEPEGTGQGLFVRAKRPWTGRDRVALVVVGAICLLGAIASALAGTEWWVFLLVTGILFLAGGLPRRR
ncbi:MAG: hypothetical protein M3174_06930 [Actinomycetota bacterium]|nr:hypothetical protein [Actinomycetota bacterium]